MPGYLIKYCCVALFCSVFMAPLSAAQVDDIRVLIDVSGSMQKTDPQNLRKPALRMLAGLIPSGSNAGVWTFGRYTNMDVKWGRVDKDWRRLAQQGAEKIHSRGQFTHIEGALRRASTGWDQADPQTRRALILLTDGKIDVSKDETKNTASRKAVIEQSIPELKRKGVNIHTIALSRNTDEALLKRLSVETGGSFEIAETADQLQRIFLKMLERSVKPDTLPLAGNRFQVDNNIREMTLLVFRKGDKETKLIAPDNTEFSRKTSSKTVQWKRDQGYDLITVEKPAAGEWRLDADIDPDNRVIVVTDLKLEVNPLPAHITPDQGLKFHVELHNDGKKIGKRSFLKFVEFKLNHEFGSQQHALPLELKKSLDIKDKGIYLYDLAPPLSEGTHEFIVEADGSTFDRTKRLSVQVQWPVTVEIDPAGEPGVKRLRVAPRQELIDPQSLTVKASLTDPEGGQVMPALEVVEQTWKADLVANRMEGEYQLLLDIEAKDHSGEAVKHRLGPYPIAGTLVPLAAQQAQAEADVEASSSEEEDPADTTEAVAPVEVIEEPAQSGGWLRLLLVIGVANTAFILVGGGIWLYLRKRKSVEEYDLVSEESQGEEIENE